MSTSSRVSATRIGLFTIGGLALLAAVIISVFGARVFATTERAVMYFRGSVFGLQTGAAVVFRGVRIGSVRAIGLVHDPKAGEFEIPVEAVIDLGLMRDGGPGAPDDQSLTLASLVAQGLTAQLAQQSLLTGQLYVDLDLRPGQGVAARPRAQRGLFEIPTSSAASWRTLQNQLTGMDLGKLVQDVSAITGALRRLVTGPQLGQLLDELNRTAATLNRLGTTLDKRVGPLAEAAQGTLGELRSSAGRAGAAIDRAGTAIDRAGVAAERIAGAAGRIEATLAADSPRLASVQRAADDLGRSAVALQRATADDSPSVQTLQGLQQTLSDVSRASRSVRELAELLERQPDALIRGRATAP